MNIHWPSGIDTAGFLQNYWQRKPLFIPNAFPDFENPLDENELAGLAVDPDANARYMECVDGNEWRMRYGPFEDDFFDSVTGNQWSILVSDVEKLLPEFRQYLQPFRFLPDWRIDDLMISYAPVGGSVGAHVDQYDVFLLQASGLREWQIENTARQQHTPSGGNADISLLGDFSADETMQLSAGDMLYLPPGFAHHGIACGDPCMTWSIGFRAPSDEELLPGIVNQLVKELPQTVRFADAGRSITDSAGLISNEDFDQLRRIVRNALNPSDDQLNQYIGRCLTEPSHDEEPGDRDCSWNDLVTATGTNGYLVCNSSHNLAYATDNTTRAMLFANGESTLVSTELAVQLCNDRRIGVKDVDAADQQVVLDLYNRYVLLSEDND